MSLKISPNALKSLTLPTVLKIRIFFWGGVWAKMISTFNNNNKKKTNDITILDLDKKNNPAAVDSIIHLWFGKTVLFHKRFTLSQTLSYAVRTFVIPDLKTTNAFPRFHRFNSLTRSLSSYKAVTWVSYTLT